MIFYRKENKMKERLAKLIDLKSIVTLIMVAALVAGWFMGKVTSEQFVPLVTMILTFYFAKSKTGTVSEMLQESEPVEIIDSIDNINSVNLTKKV